MCFFLFRTRYNFINIRFGSKGLKFLFLFDWDKTLFVRSHGLKGLKRKRFETNFFTFILKNFLNELTTCPTNKAAKERV